MPGGYQLYDFSQSGFLTGSKERATAGERDLAADLKLAYERPATKAGCIVLNSEPRDLCWFGWVG